MADVEMAFGSYYWSGNTTASANAAATPIKCAGTTTTQLLNGFTHSGTNRLTYTGTTTLYFQVTAGLSSSASAATDAAEFHIYKNGAIVTGSTVERKMPISDIGAFSICSLVSLATNDYIEIWCETSDGDDITITDGCVSVSTVG